MMNIMCCPVCRAICCILNEKDTCCKYVPSTAPGYDCPDFLKEKEAEEIPGLLKHIELAGEDDFQELFLKNMGF